MTVGWRSSSFLDDYVDEGLEVDLFWSLEEERQRQVSRLGKALAMCEVALKIPRRLGQVSDLELANDKRLTRQVGARLQTYHVAWGGEAGGWIVWNYDPEVRQAGAQVKWEEWWLEHKRVAVQEARRIATNAKQLGLIKDGNVVVHRLLNEVASLDEVLGG